MSKPGALAGAVPLRPTTLPPRANPEFTKKLKHLQQSDPVNPKDLARRLELFLIQQEAAPDGIVPRRKKVRTSSSASRTPSGPPTPKHNILPFTFPPGALRQSLDLSNFVDDVANNLSTTSSAETTIKTIAYPPPPPPLLQSSGPRQSVELSNETVASISSMSSPSAIPPPPRSSFIEPLQSDMHRVQDKPVSSMDTQTERRRPESMPWIPPQLIRTGTSDGGKRESSPIADAFTGPMPMLTLPPVSPLRASFNVSPTHSSFANTLLDALSPGARMSIGSTSTAANYTTAPSSPSAPTYAATQAPASSPNVTSRLERRKSWHPRNLVASRKTRNETGDRRMERPNLQKTAVMVEAARQGQAKEKEKKTRPKSFAFESFTASKSVPDLPAAGVKAVATPAVPVLVLEAGKAEEKHEKGSLWDRRSRRKTLGSEIERDSKEGLNSKPSIEHLRWKQLAMREKALAVSKKEKDEKNVSQKPPIRQMESPKLEAPPTASQAFEPKKRVTRPLKDLSPAILQPVVQREPSPATRYIPSKPVRPQERPKSPVQVSPVSRNERGQDTIGKSNVETFSERTTSQKTLPPLTTTAPLATLLRPSDHSRREHSETRQPKVVPRPPSPTKVREKRAAKVFGDHLNFKPTMEPLVNPVERQAQLEPVQRPRHQRDPSKPKLQLGPFPSRPPSPTSPPKKPLPRPPRYSSIPRKDTPGAREKPGSREIAVEQLTPWEQPIPIEIPAPAEQPVVREQMVPRHARAVSIEKVVASPQVVSTPRKAPPVPNHYPATDPQSRRKIFPNTDTRRPHIDRSRSRPILNQYGQPALRTGHSPPTLRPRTSSTDLRPAFLQHEHIPGRSASSAARIRPKTAGGSAQAPGFTVQVLEHEIAEMTPASIRLLRDQENLLRSRRIGANLNENRGQAPARPNRDGSQQQNRDQPRNEHQSRNIPPSVGSSTSNPQSGQPNYRQSASANITRSHTLPTLPASHTLPMPQHVSGSQLAEKERIQRVQERIVMESRSNGLMQMERRFSVTYSTESRLEAERDRDGDSRRTGASGKDKWWRVWRVV